MPLVIRRNPIPYRQRLIVGYDDGCPPWGGFIVKDDFLGLSNQDLLSVLGPEWRCPHGRPPTLVVVNEEYEK